MMQNDDEDAEGYFEDESLLISGGGGAYEEEEDQIEAADAGVEEDVAGGEDSSSVAAAAAVAEKKAKKKRKLQELKKKKAVLRDAHRAGEEEEEKEEEEVEAVGRVAKKSKQSEEQRLSPEKQFALFLQHQPQTGALTAALTLSNFIDPYQRDSGKRPCPFARAVAAGLPKYKEVLAAESDEMGCPVVFILCASALRASHVINSISQLLQCKVAKLFAKHFKVQEQIDILGHTHFPIAVGTPNRMLKLIELGALSTSAAKLFLLDMAHDQKGFNILTMKDVKADLYTLLGSLVTKPDGAKKKNKAIAAPAASSAAKGGASDDCGIAPIKVSLVAFGLKVCKSHFQSMFICTSVQTEERRAANDDTNITNHNCIFCRQLMK